MSLHLGFRITSYNVCYTKLLRNYSFDEPALAAMREYIVQRIAQRSCAVTFHGKW